MAMDAASDANLRRVVDENLALLMRPGEILSYEQWSDYSNRVIQALQELVTQGRAAEWPRLLTLRITFLERYLDYLIHRNGLGQHITQEDIQGAVVRAQALCDMDRLQSGHWERVLQLIRGLIVTASSENGQHNFQLLMLAVSLINHRIATAAFEGPQESFLFQQWDRHSNKAIGILEELVRRGGNGASDARPRLLKMRKVFLKQYLSILIRAGLSYKVTEGNIRDVVNRAETLQDMDSDARHWRRVLRLIRELKVGNSNGQSQILLDALALVEQSMQPNQ
jgi:hypothetical protein